MIVDDDVLRVGSANINNRSMGLDSECDLLIDGGRAANAGAADTIARDPVRPARRASRRRAARSRAASPRPARWSRTIDALRGDGRTLVPLEIEEPNAVEAAIAEGEALDPEGAGEYFEPAVRGGLMTRLRHWGRSRPA